MMIERLEERLMGLAVRTATCSCGRVRCEGIGVPILSTVCYCSDCQAGGRQIEALAGAVGVREPDGGTPYLTYRDDRFACVEGAELLVGYKLKPDAPTQRFVASCCNTGLFIKFAPGHWISSYRARFDGPMPPIEMRTKVAKRQSDLPIPQDAPAYRSFPLKLYGRLLAARIAMLFSPASAGQL
jgi:hypothetical protein